MQLCSEQKVSQEFKGGKPLLPYTLLTRLFKIECQERALSRLASFTATEKGSAGPRGKPILRLVDRKLFLSSRFFFLCPPQDVAVNCFECAVSYTKRLEGDGLITYARLDKSGVITRASELYVAFLYTVISLGVYD